MGEIILYQTEESSPVNRAKTFVLFGGGRAAAPPVNQRAVQSQAPWNGAKWAGGSISNSGALDNRKYSTAPGGAFFIFYSLYPRFSPWAFSFESGAPRGEGFKKPNSRGLREMLMVAKTAGT